MSHRAMFPSVLTPSRVLLSAIAVSFGGVASSVHAETPYVGEVTGTTSRVHVRSGPSTNFYPVLRLSAGDRVTVVGEESGWYAIAPPEGCYSLISKHYVDVGAGGEGVVNGNSVRVRAGSSIDEHRYAVQRKLDKGAVVRIIGEEGDSFLKITPPEGARLWISGDYVVRVPDDRLATAQVPVAPPAREPAARQVTTREVPARIVEPVRSPVTSEIVMSDIAENETVDEVEIVAPSYAQQTTAQPVINQAAEVGSIELAMVPVPDSPVPSRATAETVARNRFIQNAVAPDITPDVPDRITVSALTGADEVVALRPAQVERAKSAVTMITMYDVAARPGTETIGTDSANRNRATGASPWTATGFAPSHDRNSGSSVIDSAKVESIGIARAPVLQNSQFSGNPLTTENTAQMKDELVLSSMVRSEPVLSEAVDYTIGDQRDNLSGLDDRFDAEMIKPVEDRRLVEIAEGYRQLTEHGEERVVRLYAERRLSQVELAIATADAIRDIRSLTNNVARDRRAALEERSQMRPPPHMVTRGFDAKGELRRSMIFASPVGPKRYRLVDPALVVPRTLCYVEVPQELSIDMDQYVGRLVGIRASKKFLETGNVDPINVLVAEEFVVLDRPANNAAAQANGGEMGMMAVVDIDTLD